MSNEFLAGWSFKSLLYESTNDTAENGSGDGGFDACRCIGAGDDGFIILKVVSSRSERCAEDFRRGEIARDGGGSWAMAHIQVSYTSGELMLSAYEMETSESMTAGLECVSG